MLTNARAHVRRWAHTRVHERRGEERRGVWKGEKEGDKHTHTHTVETQTCVGEGETQHACMQLVGYKRARTLKRRREKEGGEREQQHKTKCLRYKRARTQKRSREKEREREREKHSNKMFTSKSTHKNADGGREGETRRTEQAFEVNREDQDTSEKHKAHTHRHTQTKAHTDTH